MDEGSGPRGKDRVFPRHTSGATGHREPKDLVSHGFGRQSPSDPGPPGREGLGFPSSGTRARPRPH